MVKAAVMLSCAVARQWKLFEQRRGRKTSNWLAVRDGNKMGRGYLIHTMCHKIHKIISFLNKIQVKEKTTVSWTAMKLLLAPISQKVGSGLISNCLLALETHLTGESQ